MRDERGTGRGGGESPPVMLVRCGEVDHYAGVDALLVSRGVGCGRWLPDQPAVRLNAGTRVVVVSDIFAYMNGLALRQTRRLGATAVLMMDGLVEYRNTFVNPLNGERFLRPAP